MISGLVMSCSCRWRSGTVERRRGKSTRNAKNNPPAARLCYDHRTKKSWKWETHAMQLGFIGLGTMGASLAANLQKAGHKLTVHDTRRAAAEPHVKAGAVWANSPREVAAASDVVFTSLPGPPEV